MKTIKQNELYDNVSEFLRSRGIELKEGPYSRRIRQGCTLLTDAINVAQKGLHTAKTQVETKVDEMRQVIHQKMASRGAKAAGARRKGRGATPAAAKTRAAARPVAKAKTRKNKAATTLRKPGIRPKS